MVYQESCDTNKDKMGVTLTIIRVVSHSKTVTQWWVKGGATIMIIRVDFYNFVHSSIKEELSVQLIVSEM